MAAYPRGLLHLVRLKNPRTSAMIIASLSDWWNALETGGQVYYAIAIASTFILLIQTLLMLIGMDGGDIDLDADVDVDVDVDHDGDGLGVLSFRTVIAFLVGFGWIGALSTDSGLGLFLALVLAGVAGIILMFVVYWLMKTLSKLKSDGTVHYANAIGEVGTVYLPIPPNREGPGQIEVMIQGRLIVAQAFTGNDTKIVNQAKVRVIDVLGDNSLIVQPV